MHVSFIWAFYGSQVSALAYFYPRHAIAQSLLDQHRSGNKLCNGNVPGASADSNSHATSTDSPIRYTEDMKNLQKRQPGQSMSRVLGQGGGQQQERNGRGQDLVDVRVQGSPRQRQGTELDPAQGDPNGTGQGGPQFPPHDGAPQAMPQRPALGQPLRPLSVEVPLRFFRSPGPPGVHRLVVSRYDPSIHFHIPYGWESRETMPGVYETWPHHVLPPARNTMPHHGQYGQQHGQYGQQHRQYGQQHGQYGQQQMQQPQHPTHREQFWTIPNEQAIRNHAQGIQGQPRQATEDLRALIQEQTHAQRQQGPGEQPQQQGQPERPGEEAQRASRTRSRPGDSRQRDRTRQQSGAQAQRGVQRRRRTRQQSGMRQRTGH